MLLLDEAVPATVGSRWAVVFVAVITFGVVRQRTIKSNPSAKKKKIIEAFRSEHHNVFQISVQLRSQNPHFPADKMTRIRNFVKTSAELLNGNLFEHLPLLYSCFYCTQVLRKFAWKLYFQEKA